MGDALPVGKTVLFGLINQYEDGESFKLYKAGELLMSGVDDPLIGMVASNPLLSGLLPPTFSDGKFRLYGVSNRKNTFFQITGDSIGNDSLSEYGRALTSH